ncbi:hypothetical protein GGI04_000999 [Coemansia thaxteri]|nr:hypothetical protein GGI04_000999 [Coemansia thaxteri]
MPQTAVPGLPKYSLVAPAPAHPLIVYLSNSIKRDVRLLAAMGAIKDPAVRVICSYLPHATAADDEEDVIIKSLSSAYAFPLAASASVAEYSAKPAAPFFAPATGAQPNKDPADAKRAIVQAKKLNRQRSETAPMRPTPQQQQQQRVPTSPRKEKSRHEGLGAKLGAFFNKLTLDSETSPRLRITTPSPRTSAAAKLPFPKTPGSASPLASTSLATLAEERSDAGRMHERSRSDSPCQLSMPMHQQQQQQGAAAGPLKVVHRQTVGQCQAPLGILQSRQLYEQRKPSQNSQHSAASSKASAASSKASAATAAECSAASSKPGPSAPANTRKRSFTHLGLSMESLPSSEQSRSAASAVASQQLRRAKPASDFTAIHAKLTNTCASSSAAAIVAAPTNSLGLVLQSTAVSLAPVAQHSKPLPPPARAQRHHNAAAVAHRGEPKSPNALRVNCGLTSIVTSRYAAAAASPLSAKPPAASAFPPMPSEACQAAMLSASANTQQLSLARDHQKDNRTSYQKPVSQPPVAAKAFSESTIDSSIASMLVIATSTYDYSSSIKGDLEFVRGERIIVQSKVNDDWWFGSILPASGRGSTGRSGMFPRSHVAFT